MRTSVLAALLLLVIASCQHKELCYAHPHEEAVLVVFDWSMVEKKDIPKVMDCLFYDRDGKLVGEFALPPEGGKVMVPDGAYRVIAYNADGYRNQFSDDDGVRRVGTKALSKGGMICYETPDFLCRSSRLVVLPEEDGSRVVSLTPVRRTVRVKYKVDGLRSPEGIGSVSAFLSGCSAVFDLNGGYCSERRQAGVERSLWWDLDSWNPSGAFNMFGCGFTPQEQGLEKHKHILTLFVTDKSGKKSKMIHFDVTSQVPCDVPVGITMNDFLLEVSLEGDISFGDSEEGSTESTFDPEVEDWEDIEETLPLIYGFENKLQY